MTAPSAAPPAIPNHEYVSYVSSGGFGDVFVYRDNIGREVAIKVLHLSGLTPEAREAFKVEAARMAGIRNRFVVTVYGFEIAGDGRPYISMEYCPNSLAGRITEGPLPIADGLRASIQVASAVAAAHRTELFHRDIKPANVLLTHDGTPALTDFGIAGGRGTADTQSRGLSLRYAAPEVISGDSEGEELADVYSLGATAYALFAGHAPYDVPGGDNSEAALLQRTLTGSLPRIGRPDVPASLERALAHALAKRPESRFPSAASFARALQEIEVELGFSPTDAPLGDEPISRDHRRASADEDPDDGTRLRAPQRIDPSGTPASPRAHPPQSDATADRNPTVTPGSLPSPASSVADDSQPALSEEHLRASASDETYIRDGAPRKEPTPAEPSEPERTERGSSSGSRRYRATLVASAALVLALVGGTVMLAGGQTPTEVEPTSVPPNPDTADGGLFAQPTVPTAVTVAHTADGVLVEWDPDPEPEATYVVSVTAGPEEGSSLAVDEARAIIADPDPHAQVCVRVLSVLGGASSDPSREECTR